jgi:hypothetical protein
MKPTLSQALSFVGCVSHDPPFSDSPSQSNFLLSLAGSLRGSSVITLNPEIPIAKHKMNIPNRTSKNSALTACALALFQSLAAHAAAPVINNITTVPRLTIAWIAYAHDSDDRLVLTSFFSGGANVFGRETDPSWATGFLDWTLSGDNTNSLTLIGTNALLGAYTSRTLGIYRCPADRPEAAITSSAR